MTKATANALRHRAARSVDCAGRLLDVGAARIRGAFDRKGAALAGRARSGSRHPAWFCRRAAVIRRMSFVVSILRGNMLVVDNTFRTRAWLRFAPPTCRMPRGQ